MSRIAHDLMLVSFLSSRRPPSPTLFPYTTLFRSRGGLARARPEHLRTRPPRAQLKKPPGRPESSVRLTQSVFGARSRSEEHTSELQSQSNLVCRLLLEKKKKEINVKNGATT